MQEQSHNTEAKQERLYQDVAFLTKLEPARNYANKASLREAANYIYKTFASLGEPEFQDFEVSGGEVYQNVSLLFEGQSPERIIIGAHYDVWGELPGADDNASAVAGLLETARLLHQYRQNNQLPYSLEFVAYCLEEPPFFAGSDMGSAHHVRKILREQIKVKLMICYEMIGYFSDEPGSQGFPHPSLKGLFPDRGNFIIVGGNSQQTGVAEKLAERMQPHCSLSVYPVSSPLTDGLVDLSDHRNYWKHGIPAVMVNDTSFMRNPHYHKKTDTIDTLNFPKMAQVVQGVAGALQDMNG